MKLAERHVIMYMTEVFVKAEVSYAKDLKVGALLVKLLDNGMHQVISDGYNGTEPGACNCCEDEYGESLPTVIHAEQNMIKKALIEGIDAPNAIVFVTRSPCENCAKRIVELNERDDINIQINTIYYCEHHPVEIPFALLKKANIECVKVDKRAIFDNLQSIQNRLLQKKFNEIK